MPHPMQFAEDYHEFDHAEAQAEADSAHPQDIPPTDNRPAILPEWATLLCIRQAVRTFDPDKYFELQIFGWENDIADPLCISPQQAKELHAWLKANRWELDIRYDVGAIFVWWEAPPL